MTEVLRGRLPPEAMFPVGDHRFRTAMLPVRSRLRVRVVETGPVIGPPVLCLPGWSCSVYSYRYLLPVLAESGYRAIAVDLKGQGLSDKPTDEREYATDAMTGHVLEILDALSIPAVVLVGHSMGGAIALRVALAAPHRVRALALFAPVGLAASPFPPALSHLTPGIATPLLPHLVSRWMVSRVLSLVYGSLSRPTARDVDEYWAPSQFPEFAGAMRHLLHRFDWGPITRERLATLGVPTILMFGARDRVISVPLAEARGETIPGARIVQVDGAGHVVPEEAPGIAGKAIEDLVSRAAAQRR